MSAALVDAAVVIGLDPSVVASLALVGENPFLLHNLPEALHTLASFVQPLPRNLIRKFRVL